MGRAATGTSVGSSTSPAQALPSSQASSRISRIRWRTRTTRVLSTDGIARFALPGATRTYARVTLRRNRSERPILRSGVVRTRDGKPARDPDLIRPDHGGAHGGGDAGGAHGGDHGGH